MVGNMELVLGGSLPIFCCLLLKLPLVFHYIFPTGRLKFDAQHHVCVQRPARASGIQLLRPTTLGESSEPTAQAQNMPGSAAIGRPSEGIWGLFPVQPLL